MIFPKTGKRMKFWVPLCVLVWSMTLGSASAAFKNLHEGMVPQPFKGRDLNTDEKVEWRPGKVDNQVTLVAFWATWSPRSLEMLDDLKAFQERYADHDLQIYAINCDAQRFTPTLQKLLKETVDELALPFPVIIDDGLEIFYSYGVIAVPSMALLAPDGTLYYGPSGYSFSVRDRLDDAVEELLGLAPPEKIMAAVPGYRPVDKASRYYNLALKMHGKRMYAKALGNIELAVAADTMFSSPHGLRGRILLDQEEWAAAAMSFEHAVSLDSTIVSFWAGWGRAKLMMAEDQEAGRILARGEALDETYTPILLAQAQLAARAGNQGLAVEKVSAALSLNPRGADALLMAGQQYRQAGDLRATTTVWRMAIEQIVTLPLLATKDAQGQ